MDHPIESPPVAAEPRSGHRQDAAAILLLGACSLHELVAPLRPRLGKVSQAWRRPTIALMAPALPADAIAPPHGTPPRIAAYLRADAAKAQRAALLRAEDDVLVFELIRDLITGVVRLGGSWVADPTQLTGLPGLPPVPADSLGPAAMLGLDRKLERLGFRDPGFLALWREAFGQFRTLILEPRLRRGGRVILYEATFTDRTLGPVDPGWIQEPGLAAHANALLDAMAAEARRLPGLEVVGAPEPLRVTASDVVWGGPAYTHYIPEAYAFAADLLAARLRGAEDPPMPGPAAMEAILRRAAGAARLAGALAAAESGRERALAAFEASLATGEARLAALREEAARLRGALAEAVSAQDALRAEAESLRLAVCIEREMPLLRRLGRGLDGWRRGFAAARRRG